MSTCFRMALTSKEAKADPVLKAALLKAYSQIHETVDRFPLREGATHPPKLAFVRALGPSIS